MGSALVSAMASGAWAGSTRDYRLRFAAEPRLDIPIGRVDEVAESRRIGLRSRLQFHMPHALAASRQQAGGIFEPCAVEEADIDMALESVDIPKRCIFHTCDGAAIMHELADIITALSHPHEPFPGNGPQLDRPIRKPDLYSRILLYASGESQDMFIINQPAKIQRNAPRSMSSHIPDRSVGCGAH